ncbi:transcriptional regulator [Bdellovibrio bacteriovorus]|uniref:Transcriptional regulator n=1 Tax=Bdellovibrio bacteriovorus TaxID=959 RepID=A0A162FZN6_BDEBC|nr:response regulator [Bdellovibrio bacteriovorus]KYG62880.1 transcriptional regulator [Bdellovibrio bacteriovorus]
MATLDTLGKKGRLLIIDDESELREVLMALLEESAGEITQAANGLEGIDLLKTHQFDAVLSDEKMPKKSGLEVLKWMRENNLKIPFIIHTGYGQKEMVVEAQRLGVYAFIDKPWDERKLIRTVEEALRSGMEQQK